MLLACIAMAAVLWRILGQLRARSHLAARTDQELSDLVEFTAAGVAAGLSPMTVLALHADVTGGAAGSHNAAVAWLDGRDARESLAHVETRCGPAAHGYCEALSSALVDGQPLSVVLSRLSEEMRRVRDRTGEEAVARLPVRLAVPLVTCVLPSYVLLGAIPIMAFAREAFT